MIFTWATKNKPIGLWSKHFDEEEGAACIRQVIFAWTRRAHTGL